METGEGVFLLGLVSLALGLTWISSRLSFLPIAVAAAISWLVLDAAVLTGSIGPGFTETWVEAAAILFTLMVFVPLLLQSKVEVKNEVRNSNQSFSWVSREMSSYDPSKSSTYDEHRKLTREIAERGVSRQRRRRNLPPRSQW